MDDIQVINVHEALAWTFRDKPTFRANDVAAACRASTGARLAGAFRDAAGLADGADLPISTVAGVLVAARRASPHYSLVSADDVVWSLKQSSP